MSTATSEAALARNLEALGERNRELIEQGRTGWLVAPGDPGAWAEAVRDAISDQQQRGTMRNAARLEFERRYSAESNVGQLTTIYGEARAALDRG